MLHILITSNHNPPGLHFILRQHALFGHHLGVEVWIAISPHIRKRFEGTEEYGCSPHIGLDV